MAHSILGADARAHMHMDIHPQIIQYHVHIMFIRIKRKPYLGRFGGLNPGPPAPKAGIIPLDQTDATNTTQIAIHDFYYCSYAQPN